MIAGHADALTYFSFVSPLIVQLKYRCHAFSRSRRRPTLTAWYREPP
jgi:hypothetical protein